jgi:hypothetical protein
MISRLLADLSTPTSRLDLLLNLVTDPAMFTASLVFIVLCVIVLLLLPKIGTLTSCLELAVLQVSVLFFHEVRTSASSLDSVVLYITVLVLLHDAVGSFLPC